jgi:hypothetical protein
MVTAQAVDCIDQPLLSRVDHVSGACTAGPLFYSNSLFFPA